MKYECEKVSDTPVVVNGNSHSVNTDKWAVYATGEDGEFYQVTFSFSDAEILAREYAAFKNEQISRMTASA